MALTRWDPFTTLARLDQDFDELVNRVASNRSQLDDKFARSVQQNRNSKDILEKKFAEAARRAALDPNKKPHNPFDND